MRFQRRGTLPYFVAILFFATLPVRAQAPLPAGWPARLELGLADSPGGAAAMRRTAPFQFRYQYLAGGVNTGSGWATWNTNGDFPRFYIQDSAANGTIPVFTYYMLFQSAPGGGDESSANFNNLNNTGTMAAYYNDLKLFYQKAGAFPGQMVVLHVEPDLWGFMQQRSTNDDARTVPAKVAETESSATTSASGAPASTSRSRIRPMRASTRWARARRRSTARWVPASTSRSRSSAIATRGSTNTSTATTAARGGTPRISGGTCASWEGSRPRQASAS
jgi:hypothetical protein